MNGVCLALPNSSLLIDFCTFDHLHSMIFGLILVSSLRRAVDANGVVSVISILGIESG